MFLSIVIILRKMAYDVGMIRPFLFLVSMHPVTRQVLLHLIWSKLIPLYKQIADQLGIDLIGSKSPGDAHWESWTLISKKYRGIQKKGHLYRGEGSGIFSYLHYSFSIQQNRRGTN
jgi:hypothetical protein